MQDIIGKSFHRLTVLKFVKQKKKHKYYLCRCTCGLETVVDRQKLTSGYTKSCGCYRKEVTSARAYIHGHCQERSRTYISWLQMRNRCDSKKNKSFKNYGGRGIAVCRRWSSFKNFVKDMGLASSGCTIERIDNNKGYTPSNCRWATRLEQGRNSRKCHYVEFGGERHPVSVWAERLGLNYRTLLYRISSNWPMEKALQPQLFRQNNIAA